MAFKHATQRTVAGMNDFWQNNDYEVINRGMRVPTMDKYPVVSMIDGRVVMTHIDFALDAVCTMQLRGMIAGYEKLQTQIIEYATSPAFAFVQTTHERMWQMLTSYKMVATETREQSIMDELVESLVEHFGEHAQVFSIGSRTASAFPDLGEDQEFFELVLEQLEFNPKRLQARLQMEFLADFARYAELTHKLLMAHIKIEQLGQLLKALKREQKARETEQELWEAKRKIARLEAEADAVAIQHEQAISDAVRQARIMNAVDLLVAMGPVTLSQDALVEVMPDIAAEVLAGALQLKVAPKGVPDGTEVFGEVVVDDNPDWLTDVEVPISSFTTDESGDDLSWLNEFADDLTIGGGRGDLLVEEQPFAEPVGAPRSVDHDSEGVTGQEG